MTYDYKDLVNMQNRYPGTTKGMRDIYESLNMDSINLYSDKNIREPEKSEDKA